MATESGGVRISFEVPKEVHDKLQSFLPWGTKAEVMRSLIEVLIEAQLTDNRYVADDLLKGRCRLTRRDSDVQNLNTTVPPT